MRYKVFFKKRLGQFYMLIAILLGSLTTSIVKTLASYNASVLEITFIRNVGTLIMCLLIIKKDQYKLLTLNKNVFKHFGHAFFALLAMLSYFKSYMILSLADATAISFLTPVFIAAISAILFRRQINFSIWFSITLGIVGVLMMINLEHMPLMSGIVFGCLASLFGAIALIILKELRKSQGTNEINLIYMCMSLSLLIPFVYKDLSVLSKESIYILLILGIGGIAEQFFLVESFNYSPVYVLAPLGYTSIIWNSILGFIIWREVPDLSTIYASCFIILSSVLILFYNISEEQNENH